MTDHTIEELDAKGLRSFALTFGAMVVALFGLFFPWVLEGRYPLWPWAVWSALALWGFAAPLTLRPFYRAWMKFGLMMGKITTPLILGIIYYLVITPTGVIASLFRSDPMQRDCQQATDSFRIASVEKPHDHMKNPF